MSKHFNYWLSVAVLLFAAAWSDAGQWTVYECRHIAQGDLRFAEVLPGEDMDIHTITWGGEVLFFPSWQTSPQSGDTRIFLYDLATGSSWWEGTFNQASTMVHIQLVACDSNDGWANIYVDGTYEFSYFSNHADYTNVIIVGVGLTNTAHTVKIQTSASGGDVSLDYVATPYVLDPPFVWDNTNVIPGCGYFTSVAGRTTAPANYHMLQGGFSGSCVTLIDSIQFSTCSVYCDFTNPVYPNNSDLATLISFWEGSDPYSCTPGQTSVDLLVEELPPSGCWIVTVDVPPFTLSGSFAVSQTFLQDLGGGNYAFPPAGCDAGPMLAGPQFLHPLNAPPYGLDTTMVYNGSWGAYMKVLPVDGGVTPDPGNCYGGDPNCPCPPYWYGGYEVDPNGACVNPYAGFYLGLTGTAPPECEHDGDCDDGNPCTIDTCVDGHCQYTLECYVDDDCDDDDPCTEDVCVFGCCEHLPICGDCDDDDDVDLLDFLVFQTCYTGPGRPLDPGCECCDCDCDGDVDLLDFDVFQVAYTGPQKTHRNGSGSSAVTHRVSARNATSKKRVPLAGPYTQPVTETRRR